MAKLAVDLPLGPLRDLLAWWRATKVEGLIIGGLAMAFLGRPRITQDVDAIVLVKEDLSLGALPFELEAVRREQKVKVGRLSVPVPIPEDLIVLKAVANRPKDRIDILEVLNQCTDLNYAQILKHVDAFAQDLEAPELYQELDRMLREHRKTQRRKKK